MQNFSHVMEQGGAQQVRISLPRCFQVFEYLISMCLLCRLHLLEKAELSRRKMAKQSLARGLLVGTEQAIPELA